MAAAALAAGVMATQAQSNVYSQNIVGYVNVPLPTGYTLVANQLDLDGTGASNTIYSVLGTNLPPNTQVLAWNGSTYSSSKLTAAHKWVPENAAIDAAMSPGSGFFVDVPETTNVTLVGTVIQGTNNIAINAGYQIVSPIAPIAGGVTSVEGYVPSKGDQILIWNGSLYSSKKYSGTAWIGGEPTFSVGESVFLNAVSNNVWTQTFNPQ